MFLGESALSWCFMVGICILLSRSKISLCHAPACQQQTEVLNRGGGVALQPAGHCCGCCLSLGDVAALSRVPSASSLCAAGWSCLGAVHPAGPHLLQIQKPTARGIASLIEVERSPIKVAGERLLCKSQIFRLEMWV